MRALALCALLALSATAHAGPIYSDTLPTAGERLMIRTPRCAAAVWLVGDRQSERSAASCVRT